MTLKQQPWHHDDWRKILSQPQEVHERYRKRAAQIVIDANVVVGEKLSVTGYSRLVNAVAMDLRGMHDQSYHHGYRRALTLSGRAAAILMTMAALAVLFVGLWGR